MYSTHETTTLYLPCEPICGDGYHPNINITHSDSLIPHGRTTRDNSNGDFCDDGLYIQFDGCDRNCEKDFTDFICVDSALPNINTVCTERVCTGTATTGDYQFTDECYDGNAVANDGCTTCVVDCGYQCHEGDPLDIDVCKEICGDGLDLKNYECDDGNYNSGDGCSQLCFVEPGWNCTGGRGVGPPNCDILSTDICMELCGDGRNFGMYECDDANLENGDGCDEYCRVEWGWECYNGSPVQKDSCFEICGDGLDFFQYPCDDGNVLVLDGCDELC